MTKIEALREALDVSGLNQKAFADRLGVSQPTISAWLNNTRKIPYTKLVDICKLGKIDIDDIDDTSKHTTELIEMRAELRILREDRERSEKRRIEDLDRQERTYREQIAERDRQYLALLDKYNRLVQDVSSLAKTGGSRECLRRLVDLHAGPTSVF